MRQRICNPRLHLNPVNKVLCHNENRSTGLRISLIRVGEACHVHVVGVGKCESAKFGHIYGLAKEKVLFDITTECVPDL